MGDQRSARSLLVLLLGEYVLPAGRPFGTRAAVAALRLLGVAEPAVRQAIRRLAQDGWLEPGGGRSTWVLGPTATELLTEGKSRFGRASRPVAPWDGRWLLLRTTVPESQRATRHQLRAALSFQGFGSLGQGWWISADRHAEETAQAVVSRLGVRATSLYASSGGIGARPEDLVDEAWDLAEVRARWEKFLGEFRIEPDGSEEAVFRSYTNLVDQWRRTLAIDPQLPAELLPADWPGHEARTLLDRRYREWRPTAAAWWSTA